MLIFWMEIIGKKYLGIYLIFWTHLFFQIANVAHVQSYYFNSDYCHQYQHQDILVQCCQQLILESIQIKT